MPPVVEHDALPAGTRLAEFEIERVLGVGGFGIVYLAFDHALERQVAIKEYMPAALAARGQGREITLRSAAHAETFALGLRSFINEARLLARFDHPALVKVYRFWEEHGTAYMVMPFYKGRTVQAVRREMDAPAEEAWLRALILPVLGALECLHREHVFHRDIAPDNILILDDEEGTGVLRPVLLDLGAARHVIGDRTQSLTAILKPSFAPIEQYAETAQLRQGAWTDLYALAAVVHFCITGRPPTPASARAVHDDLPSLQDLREGLASGFGRNYSSSFVLAVDHALAVKPQDRPESILAWREALSGLRPCAKRAQVQGERAVPDTVVLRPLHGETLASQDALAAQAYMTTVPAAVPLRGPPAVGAGSSPRQPAIRQARPVGGEVAAPRWRAAWMAQSRHYLVGAAMAASFATAAWWAQGHWRPQQPPAALGLPDSKSDLAATSPAEDRPALAPPGHGTPPRAGASQHSAPAVPAGSENATRPGAAGPAGDNEPINVRRREVVAKEDRRSEPLNPRRACGDRMFITMAICMKQRCSRPAYAAHPECKRMRQQEEASRAYP